MSLLDNSKKLALPEDYEIISEPPYRKNTPLSLPVCTINIEYLIYQDTLFKTEFDKEIAWLKSFDSKNLPWSSYHSNNSTCNNSDCVPGRNSFMPLINEKVNTLKSQYHCMGITKKTINFINKGQIAIDASNQPMYTISKEVQIRYAFNMILNFEVLLLIYTRSIREGNFELYLALLYRMLPWVFPLDRYNYALCATIY